jgi:hypothetical protein
MFIILAIANKGIKTQMLHWNLHLASTLHQYSLACICLDDCMCIYAGGYTVCSKGCVQGHYYAYAVA